MSGTALSADLKCGKIHNTHRDTPVVCNLSGMLYAFSGKECFVV